MKIIKKAQAGSFESSDILILVEPVNEGEGRKIELDSAVQFQFGDKILELIIHSLDKHQIADIHLVIKDKGAIEPVIRARIETALLRGANQQKGTMY
ncbi:MAG: citrate lyase acyl carrier protein [Bacteroidales bacterium]|nr:citrate lyase acyl carrier protein [Bacteroidales bacterium]